MFITKESLNYDNKNIVVGKNQSFKFKKNGLYQTKTPNGNIIYSLESYKYIKGDTLMKDLKKVEEDKFISEYLMGVIDVLSDFLKKNKFDYIVNVPSSSIFLQKVYYKLLDLAGSTQPTINIIKNHPNKIEFNRELALKKLNVDLVNKLEIDFYKNLSSHIKTGKFEAKKFYKPLLKFAKNMFTFETKTNLKNKKILIIDDNLATGTTMKNILDSLSEQHNCLVVGLTLFKFT